MKIQNVKNIDTAKIYLRVKWFGFRQSNTRFFFYGFVTGVISVIIIELLVGNFSSIHTTLIEIDTNGRIQYFTSIGGALLGVLAIISSLTLFAAQHSTENVSVRMLQAIRNEPRVKFDYALISIVSLVLFIFGITPKQGGYFTSFSFILAIAFVAIVLWRVFSFFRFILKFIDPIEQINSLSSETKKNLLKTRGLLSLIRDQEKHDRIPEGNPVSDINEIDLFVTANFDHQDIYLKFQTSILALVNRIKVYAEKGVHEVTAPGYQELADIAKVYFSTRTYSTASAGLFVQDARTDQYLMLILEQLKILHTQALRLKDGVELQQNFRCHAEIAIEATKYKFIGTDIANTNLNFVIGYLHQNIIDSIQNNFDDAAMNGIRYLSAVITHIPPEHYLSMSQLADELKKQALTTISIKRWYITQEAVNGLVTIVIWSLRDSFSADQLLKSTLKNLCDIAHQYITSGMTVSMNGGALSSAIAVVNQNSIPYIVNEYIVQYWEKNALFDKGTFSDFIEYYEELGKIAAESGSFLMHFVLSALSLHLEQFIRLRWHKNQKQPEQFLEGISQILTAYKRIYSYLPKDYENNNFGYLAFERLKEKALWAVKEKDNKLLSAMIDAFSSFYEQAREKTSSEFTALRIYVDLVELGAVASAAGMNEVADRIVNMAVDVQKEQLEKHAQEEAPEQYKEQIKELLSTEIWRIRGNYRQHHPMRHDDLKLENLISFEDLTTYLNRIEKEVYNRQTTM